MPGRLAALVRPDPARVGPAQLAAQKRLVEADEIQSVWAVQDDVPQPSDQVLLAEWVGPPTEPRAAERRGVAIRPSLKEARPGRPSPYVRTSLC